MILEQLNYYDIVKKHGITLFKQKRITNMAFADDINILGRSVENPKSLLLIFQNALAWTRCLKAKPSKFGAIGYGNAIVKVVKGREMQLTQEEADSIECFKKRS